MPMKEAVIDRRTLEVIFRDQKAEIDNWIMTMTENKNKYPIIKHHKMRIMKHFCYALILLGFTSCGASDNRKTIEKPVGEDLTVEKPITENKENTDLINTVYNKFVFAIDSDGNEPSPETYFTANALRKLQDAYEYDCYDGPCYAYYTLRTEAQDSNPKTDDISQICDIETAEDGWYIVSYLDMGWSGKTRIKIVDGKIDDYERISSDLSQ